MDGESELKSINETSAWKKLYDIFDVVKSVVVRDVAGDAIS